MRRIVSRNFALGRRHGLILLAWAAIVVVAVPLAVRKSDHLSLGGYAVPGSQSARVNAIFAQQYPRTSHFSLAILLWPRKGATELVMTRAIYGVEDALDNVTGISLPRQAREQAQFGAGLVGPIFMPLQVDVSESQSRAIVQRLKGALSQGRSATDRTVEVHLLGESALAASLEEASQQGLSKAEKIGFPILLVVLIAIFGSLSAAILPLALAAVAVIVTGALIYLLSLATQLSVFTVDTASMFGIGVAVDYSLIIVSRVRQELRNGRDLSSARAIALATSGRTVIFSGIVVMASLAATWLIPINTLRSMAVGAIIVVAVAMLASTTLLPGLIDLFGARWTNASVLRKVSGKTDNGNATPRWDRWASLVTRRPIMSIALVACVLVPVAVPMLSMRIGMGTREQLSAQNETQVGLREAARLEGPGALGPLYVALQDHRHAGTSNDVEQWASTLRRQVPKLINVKKLGPIEVSRNKDYAVFAVTLTIDPEAPAAEDVVQRLRSNASSLLHGHAVNVVIGGTSASLLDDKRKISDGLWKMILAILVTSFVVLIVVLRSLLLPLKAVVMNMISVCVSYGVLVIVFQWGIFDGLFNYRSPGRIYTLVPPLVLAIVFGLSMDYEVFLLSRIRERWLASQDSRLAVAEGLAASATAISGAAFILVCVFAIFVGTGVQTIKELGLGAAVAIGIDATIVRLMLVPATMQVLGNWNWWMPGPLNRVLPVRREVVSVDTASNVLPESVSGA